MNIHKRLNFVVKRGEDEVYDKKEDVVSTLFILCLRCCYSFQKDIKIRKFLD